MHGHSLAHFRHKDGDNMSLFTEYGVKAQGAAPDPFTKVFTSSQTYTIPDGVDKLDITVVNGGNGGSIGGVTDGYYYGGNGGGGGYVKNQYDVSVSSGDSISVVIGAGGTAGAYVDSWTTTPAGRGGTSSFNGISPSAQPTTVINGGSGAGTGGGAVSSSTAQSRYGGNGGANGGNGSQGQYAGVSGTGQGTTTRGINDVLYAGGGAGGMASNGSFAGSGGVGGSGGGGNGQGCSGGGVFVAGSAGTSNTGGGGGGAANPANTASSTAYKGGSGVVIIKWKG